MAYGNPNPGNDSDYSDAAPAPAKTEPEEKEGDKEEQQTFLLDEAFFMGKKFDVGEEFVGKIVAKHDGQVEVTYATEPEKGEEGEGEAAAPAPQGGGDEMGQMMY